ncbi:MAG: pyridoxamine 5'-phosphate oxidase family protein [Actinomycetota bacterium]
MTYYTDAQRALQDRFESRPLADRLEQAIIAPEIDEMQQAFIQSRDFFFLSTVTAAGEPTVSYKGGDVGIVTVVDQTSIAFPMYDGNGMFLSAGNIADTAKIGLLFIDFETPNRVRVQATARLEHDDPLLERYPGAITIVRATVDHVFVNCARYIHEHERVAASPYVPDGDGAQPHPSWKRIDLLQDALTQDDQDRSADEGIITIEDYGAKLAAGES